MITINTIMTFLLIAGLSVFLISLISLIAGSRKKKRMKREQARRNVLANTVKTVLNYEQPKHGYSLRRSS